MMGGIQNISPAWGTVQDRRDAIRETWGRHAWEHPGVLLRFYTYQHDGGGTGLLLEREALHHRDLIIIRNMHLSDAALENDQEGVTQKVSSCAIFCRLRVQFLA